MAAYNTRTGALISEHDLSTIPYKRLSAHGGYVFSLTCPHTLESLLDALVADDDNVVDLLKWLAVAYTLPAVPTRPPPLHQMATAFGAWFLVARKRVQCDNNTEVALRVLSVTTRFNSGVWPTGYALFSAVARANRCVALRALSIGRAELGHVPMELAASAAFKKETEEMWAQLGNS